MWLHGRALAGMSETLGSIPVTKNTQSKEAVVRQVHKVSMTGQAEVTEAALDTASMSDQSL